MLKSYLFRSIFYFAVFLLGITNSYSQTREKAFQINEKLGRGVNYGNMFEAPSETGWGNPWNPEYAKIIAGLGFNHVRIPIRWEPSDRSSATFPYTISASFLARIKQVVDSAKNNGLYAIINMHHHDGLFDNPNGQKARFLSQWEQIATYFKDYSDSLLFEILNEPHGNITPTMWNQFSSEALSKIRLTNPNRVVVLGTAEWGGLGGLTNLVIPNDENLILTIHYYNPFSFTHQGAEWSEGSDVWLGTKWLDSEDERQVVEQEFAPLVALSKSLNIPVHIGEFGAYNKADMASRSRWTTFLSRYFEQQNFSWAYWEFSAGFGFYDPNQKTLNSDLVNALLHNPIPEPFRYIRTAVFTNTFDNGTQGWVVYTQTGANAQLSAQAGTATVSITSGGAEGWHIQMVKNTVTLEAGKTYKLSFKGKAESKRNITLYAGKSSDPWTSYSGYNSFEIADTTSEYSITFNMTVTDYNARIVFDLGGSSANVLIDEIKLEELSIPTGTFSIPENKNQLFPNPVNDVLFVKSENRFNRYTIYSLSGKTLQKGPLNGNQTTIDLSGINSGMYIFQFQGKTEFNNQRFIKK